MTVPMLEPDEVRVIVIQALRHAATRGLGLGGGALDRFVENLARRLKVPPRRLPPGAIRFEMRDPLLRALVAAGYGGEPAVMALRVFDEHLAWHHPATSGQRTVP